MLQLRAFLRTGLLVAIACTAGFGYDPLYTRPTHGWLCALPPDSDHCLVLGPDGAQLLMGAGSRARYVVFPSPPGTHVTVRCR